MFGIYSNQRLSKEESKILKENPDDYNWYCIYVQTIFRDRRFFQVREDIELPQSEDDDGVVLMFQGGDVVYFKTMDGDVTNEEVQSVYDVCSYLEGLFNRPIKAYVVFPPDGEIKADKIEGDGEVTIVFSTLRNDDGEEIIERLESKLKNHEEFTIPDSIDHMLLPYTGFKDRKVFDEKFKNYMKLVMEYGG
ncbi:hypothetical protein [Methanobrevibacter sp.]